MFIVNAPRESQAPLGAARHDGQTAPRHMPLLTELAMGSVGQGCYKHDAPGGALAHGEKCETFRQVQHK
jgi:hypothetical protein